MLPKESPLARKQFKHLHVYSDADHLHSGQTPVVLDLASKNAKIVKKINLFRFFKLCKVQRKLQLSLKSQKQ